MNNPGSRFRTRGLSPDRRRDLVDRHWRPYRTRVEDAVRERIAVPDAVLDGCRLERGVADFEPEREARDADGAEIRTGIYPVEALKPTGAGDSFMAGLMTGLAAGQDLRDAILRGSACASVTVSRPGCAPAMADTPTLEYFMATHPGPTPA